MKAAFKLVSAAGICTILGANAPAEMAAQDVEQLGRMHGVRPPPGYYDVLVRYPNAYQFEQVWKEITRRVYERRQELVRRGDLKTLNAHLDAGPSVMTAQANATAVTGTFRVPVLVGYFKDSTQVFHPDTAALRSLLFGTSAAPPYSFTTYYLETSDSLLTATGDVIGWYKADSASTWYEGSNNGLNPGTDHVGDFIKELLTAADPTIDFSVYDNDSNGAVDVVAVLFPLKGGACGGSHIWAHRWTLSSYTGSAYTTNDGVIANDYMIQSAVGGPSGCDETQIMPIGTFSHEFGHALGLPDLYDLSGNSQGIGHWGLMGSGNWNVQSSPAHMEAWSKDALGWIAIDTASVSSGTGARSLNPIISSDTALWVKIESANEYFLLENRHRLGSESSALHGEGLLIWHVDPDRIAARWGSNTVNSALPHGLDLEQADGLDNLGNNVNRGDSGDPWPGSRNRTVFGPSTTPNSEKNDNTNSGLNITGITVNGDKSVSFQLNFNVVSELITTNIGAGTQVRIDGTLYDAPYAASWAYPSTHTIAVDATQGDTLVRYAWQSWSDGGAISHTVTADATPDTFTANLQTEHRLRATADIQGTVSSSHALDAEGIVWLLPTDTDTLTAAPADPSYVFVQWSGDTTWTGDTLVVVMTKPYTVHADFRLPVALGTTALVSGVMGASYVDTLSATGGLGTYTWSWVGGDTLTSGLTLDPAGVLSGTPEEDGSFAFVFRAQSGALFDEDTVTLTITRPSVSVDDAATQLIGPLSPLTADEQRFMDLIGNKNGRYDIGDFRAYLQDAGVITDVVAADVLKTVEQAKAEEEGQ